MKIEKGDILWTTKDEEKKCESCGNVTITGNLIPHKFVVTGVATGVLYDNGSFHLRDECFKTEAEALAECQRRNAEVDRE